MFPTGRAGAALLLLRCAVAALLLFDGTARWTLVTSVWGFLAFAAPALFLCLGFLTPYSALVCALLQAVSLTVTGGHASFHEDAFHEHGFHLVISIALSLVAALIGPGAYSVDARIFGRRLLNLARSAR